MSESTATSPCHQGMKSCLSAGLSSLGNMDAQGLCDRDWGRKPMGPEKNGVTRQSKGEKNILVSNRSGIYTDRLTFFAFESMNYFELHL